MAPQSLKDVMRLASRALSRASPADIDIRRRAIESPTSCFPPRLLSCIFLLTVVISLAVVDRRLSFNRPMPVMITRMAHGQQAASAAASLDDLDAWKLLMRRGRFTATPPFSPRLKFAALLETADAMPLSAFEVKISRCLAATRRASI